ncbi:MAG TPA: hypothetical protein VMY99_04695 [Nevskiaceae bacterium]|nr:hypothetical protein [Nevskiaceae bacterium]
MQATLSQAAVPRELTFYPFTHPSGIHGHVPHAIELAVPQNSDVANERLHLLTHIPWHDKYLQHVPAKYQDFFLYVLPHLNTRTTNVHTALSMSFLPELLASADGPVDKHVVHLGVILHDSGWSTCSHHEIADSLDYKGVSYTPNAAAAKKKHTVRGHTRAGELLNGYTQELSLSPAQTRLICDIALYHEKPWGYTVNGKTPIELVLACEADRLWPFTHENFWLDTIRKGVDPMVYIENVAAEINSGLLLTDFGRQKAVRMVAQRRAEVAAHAKHVRSTVPLQSAAQ